MRGEATEKTGTSEMVQYLRDMRVRDRTGSSDAVLANRWPFLRDDHVGAAASWPPKRQVAVLTEVPARTQTRSRRVQERYSTVR